MGEMDEGSEMPLPPQDVRMGKLQEWFEKIYQDMKDRVKPVIGAKS